MFFPPFNVNHQVSRREARNQQLFSESQGATGSFFLAFPQNLAKLCCHFHRDRVMAPELALSFSVVSVIEDVLQTHGSRLSDIHLASRKAEEACTYPLSRSFPFLISLFFRQCSHSIH
ncbi:hypothetical protein VNO80_15389 [Phaseolus coccineus]|uniref:Uncharacterized protein n=1 Tax=Phaseolus coccineus TaxID=3886 RepID=A0AAN9MRC5_PHACN